MFWYPRRQYDPGYLLPVALLGNQRRIQSAFQDMALLGYPGHPQCPNRKFFSAVPKRQIGPILYILRMLHPLVDCVYDLLLNVVLGPLALFDHVISIQQKNCRYR